VGNIEDTLFSIFSDMSYKILCQFFAFLEETALDFYEVAWELSDFPADEFPL
jgi:hypothetical protein